MGTPEELAFLLQESGTALVDASDVLHAVDHSLADKNNFMPKGMTEADGWMARHGNPLVSTETALKLVHMAGGMPSMAMVIDSRAKFATAVIQFDYARGEAKAETLPIAICAAVLDALDKKGKLNV